VPDSVGGTNFEPYSGGKKPVMPWNRGHDDLRLDESRRKFIMEIYAAA
jgi:hypothetical protein